MPNWCENNLSVIGEKNEVKRFYEKGLEKGKNKDCSEWGLFPYHPYDGEWDYDWCCDNWGTKWEIDFSEYGEAGIIGDDFWACFLTAWAPPVQWLKKVQSDYPTLTFELSYNENGCEFKGRAYTIRTEDSVCIFDEELVWFSPYGGRVKFFNIKWVTEDNKEIQETELPKETILEVYEIDSDFDEEGFELLSDKYGFPVSSFDYEIVHSNDDDL